MVDKKDKLLNLIFPVIKRKEIPDPYYGLPNVYKPGICMRYGCGGARFIHPERGEFVLCKDHSEEVIEGKAKSPPLRTSIDYIGGLRKTFIPDYDNLVISKILTNDENDDDK